MTGPGHAPADLLAEVLAELQAREPIFHRPELGTTREDFDRLMAPEFHEIGASGRRYTRAFMLDQLTERHAHLHEDVLEASEFGLTPLAPDLYLLNYTLLQDRVRWTRRSTLWRRTNAGWVIVFHQGTIMEKPTG